VVKYEFQKKENIFSMFWDFSKNFQLLKSAGDQNFLSNWIFSSALILFASFYCKQKAFTGKKMIIFIFRLAHKQNSKSSGAKCNTHTI
jgi:hypothetical protein